jgi:hypothetical protein
METQESKLQPPVLEIAATCSVTAGCVPTFDDCSVRRGTPSHSVPFKSGALLPQLLPPPFAVLAQHLPPSPGPKTGCHDHRQSAQCLHGAVSILTRPEDRVPLEMLEALRQCYVVSILTRPEDRVPPRALRECVACFQVSILTRPEDRVPHLTDSVTLVHQ